MESWRELIEKGNLAYSMYHWDEAESQYQLAKSQAKVLLLSWVDAEEAVASLVISYHNLADLYGALNFQEKRYKELYGGHMYLLTMLQSDDLTSQQVDAFLRGVNRTYLALLENIKKRHHIYMQ